LLCRFRWVYCQIVYLRLCLPGRIRHALDELPETLDETYEIALRNINKANWEFAHRLLQCVSAAFRPLRVAELAEILSFDFKTGPIPKFHEDLRLEDPVEAVLSTTSSLLAIVDVEGSPVIQFSHFSVKEYLTSDRLAGTNDILSRRYHISMTPAHTLAAQACLGILLHLDKNVVNRDSLEKYPLVEYAAKHWIDHAQIEGVSGNVEDGMKRLFDPNKPHLAIWVWIYDPILKPWEQTSQEKMPLQPQQPGGSPLHYAALCGLHAIVKFLIIQHSQDVDSLGFAGELTPLHLASEKGHEDVARLLLEHGADITLQSGDGSTPLHYALNYDNNEVAHLLLEHGADSTAQDYDGWTPLHLASISKYDYEARLLLEHGADIAAQTNEGFTPLHFASEGGYENIVRFLLEHGADTTARNVDGSTPSHLASKNGHRGVVRLLLEHSEDITAQADD
jgi:ankyrin repeat protein